MVLNVPKLRFPEFSGEWEEKHLGDIITLMQSGLSRKLDEKDIGLPVLRSNNLINNKLDISNISYWYDIDDKGANLENYFLKKGDLLVNFINSLKQIGKIAIYNGELKRNSIFTTNIMRLRFKKDINEIYIYNHFQTKKYSDYIQSITKPAVNQASFTTVDFKRFKLGISSIPEQKKIASFLSKVDEKIEKLEKKQELWETYKKGMMQKIFSQELRFKDENGGDYSDWEEKRLGDISQLTSSKRVYLADYAKKGIPFYRGKEISSLKKGELIDDLLYISEERYGNFKDKFGVPKENDILITSVGTLGNVYRVPNNEPFYFKDGNLIWMKNILEYSHFVEYALEFNKKKILSSSIGSTQKALTIIELNKIKILLPCISEQKKIVNLISAIDAKIEQTIKELDINKKFKMGLLQQLFC
jgi:type I restriction enzyme S subunit